MVAVDGDSDGLAPLDDGDGGIGISGNAFAPGVFPFGGGQFVPAPDHAGSMVAFPAVGKDGYACLARRFIGRNVCPEYQ